MDKLITLQHIYIYIIYLFIFVSRWVNSRSTKWQELCELPVHFWRWFSVHVVFALCKKIIKCVFQQFGNLFSSSEPIWGINSRSALLSATFEWLFPGPPFVFLCGGCFRVVFDGCCCCCCYLCCCCYCCCYLCCHSCVYYFLRWCTLFLSLFLSLSVYACLSLSISLCLSYFLFLLLSVLNSFLVLFLTLSISFRLSATSHHLILPFSLGGGWVLEGLGWGGARTATSHHLTLPLFVSILFGFFCFGRQEECHFTEFLEVFWLLLLPTRLLQYVLLFLVLFSSLSRIFFLFLHRPLCNKSACLFFLSQSFFLLMCLFLFLASLLQKVSLKHLLLKHKLLFYFCLVCFLLLFLGGLNVFWSKLSVAIKHLVLPSSAWTSVKCQFFIVMFFWLLLLLLFVFLQVELFLFGNMS